MILFAEEIVEETPVLAEDMVEEVLSMQEPDGLELVTVEQALVTQASHLLEESDINNVLSTIQADEFNDLFTGKKRTRVRSYCFFKPCAKTCFALFNTNYLFSNAGIMFCKHSTKFVKLKNNNTEVSLLPKLQVSLKKQYIYNCKKT